MSQLGQQAGIYYFLALTRQRFLSHPTPRTRVSQRRSITLPNDQDGSNTSALVEQGNVCRLKSISRSPPTNRLKTKDFFSSFKKNLNYSKFLLFFFVIIIRRDDDAFFLQVYHYQLLQVARYYSQQHNSNNTK